MLLLLLCIVISISIIISSSSSSIIICIIIIMIAGPFAEVIERFLALARVGLAYAPARAQGILLSWLSITISYCLLLVLVVVLLLLLAPMEYQ